MIRNERHKRKGGGHDDETYKISLKGTGSSIYFYLCSCGGPGESRKQVVLLRDGTVNTLHPWLWNLFGNTADVEIRGDIGSAGGLLLGSHVLCRSNRINAGRDERIPAQLYSFIKFNT